MYSRTLRIKRNTKRYC